MTALAAPSAFAQQGDPIAWSITPYFWAPDTTLDLTVQDNDIIMRIYAPDLEKFADWSPPVVEKL